MAAPSGVRCCSWALVIPSSSAPFTPASAGMLLVKLLACSHSWTCAGVDVAVMGSGPVAGAALLDGAGPDLALKLR